MGTEMLETRAKKMDEWARTLQELTEFSREACDTIVAYADVPFLAHQIPPCFYEALDDSRKKRSVKKQGAYRDSDELDLKKVKSIRELVAVFSGSAGRSSGSRSSERPPAAGPMLSY